MKNNKLNIESLHFNLDILLEEIDSINLDFRRNNIQSRELLFDLSDVKLNNRDNHFNVQQKIQFILYKNNPECFVLRYVLSLESFNELFKNYEGILDKELDQEFRERVQEINRRTEHFDYFNKTYNYCEYSHKSHSNNQPNIFTYKSRILICSKINDPKDAFKIVLEMYDKHRDVLKTRS